MSNFLRDSLMRRLQQRVEAGREEILNPLAMPNVSCDSLEPSGLSSTDRYHIQRWFKGLVSGRSTMFALLSGHLEEETETTGIIPGSDVSSEDSGLQDIDAGIGGLSETVNKKLFSLQNQAQNSQHRKGKTANSSPSSADENNDNMGAELALLSSTVNLPAFNFLCDRGYLHDKCFSLSPCMVLREAVELIRAKAPYDSNDQGSGNSSTQTHSDLDDRNSNGNGKKEKKEGLGLDQINLAVKQLRIDFLLDQEEEEEDDGEEEEEEEEGEEELDENISPNRATSGGNQPTKSSTSTSGLGQGKRKKASASKSSHNSTNNSSSNGAAFSLAASRDRELYFQVMLELVRLHVQEAFTKEKEQKEKEHNYSKSGSTSSSSSSETKTKTSSAGKTSGIGIDANADSDDDSVDSTGSNSNSNSDSDSISINSDDSDDVREAHKKGLSRPCPKAGVELSTLLPCVDKGTHINDLIKEALGADVVALEKSNKLLKPYLTQLTALKIHLASQHAQIENNAAYYTLGVSTLSSSSDVKKAYHKLSRKLHPDKGGSNEQFRALQDAYQEVLKRQQSLEEEEGGDEKDKDGNNSNNSSAKASFPPAPGSSKSSKGKGKSRKSDRSRKSSASNKRAETVGRRAARRALGGTSDDDSDDSGLDSDDSNSDSEAEEDLDSEKEKEEEEEEEEDETDNLDLPKPPKKKKSFDTDIDGDFFTPPPPPESESAEEEEALGTSADDSEKEKDLSDSSSRESQPHGAVKVEIDESAPPKQQSLAVLRGLSVALKGIKGCSDQCTSLAQMLLAWQRMVDGVVSTQCNNGTEGSDADRSDRSMDTALEAPTPLAASDDPPLVRRGKAVRSLDGLIDLVFNDNDDKEITDTGKGGQVSLDAKSVSLTHVLKPLEGLCENMQSVASLAMRLPGLGDHYGRACAQNAEFIKSVEACMADGLEALKNVTALMTVEAQLSSCIARLHCSEEYRHLKLGGALSYVYEGKPFSEEEEGAISPPASPTSRSALYRAANNINMKDENDYDFGSIVRDQLQKNEDSYNSYNSYGSSYDSTRTRTRARPSARESEHKVVPTQFTQNYSDFSDNSESESDCSEVDMNYLPHSPDNPSAADPDVNDVFGFSNGLMGADQRKRDAERRVEYERLLGLVNADTADSDLDSDIHDISNTGHANKDKSDDSGSGDGDGDLDFVSAETEARVYVMQRKLEMEQEVEEELALLDFARRARRAARDSRASGDNDKDKDRDDSSGTSSDGEIYDINDIYGERYRYREGEGDLDGVFDVHAPSAYSAHLDDDDEDDDDSSTSDFSLKDFYDSPEAAGTENSKNSNSNSSGAAKKGLSVEEDMQNLIDKYMSTNPYTKSKTDDASKEKSESTTPHHLHHVHSSSASSAVEKMMFSPSTYKSMADLSVDELLDLYVPERFDGNTPTTTHTHTTTDATDTTDSNTFTSAGMVTPDLDISSDEDRIYKDRDSDSDNGSDSDNSTNSTNSDDQWPTSPSVFDEKDRLDLKDIDAMLQRIDSLNENAVKGAKLDKLASDSDSDSDTERDTESDTERDTESDSSNNDYDRYMGENPYPITSERLGLARARMGVDVNIDIDIDIDLRKNKGSTHSDNSDDSDDIDKDMHDLDEDENMGTNPFVIGKEGDFSGSGRDGLSRDGWTRSDSPTIEEMMAEMGFDLSKSDQQEVEEQIYREFGLSPPNSKFDNKENVKSSTSTSTRIHTASTTSSYSNTSKSSSLKEGKEGKEGKEDRDLNERCKAEILVELLCTAYRSCTVSLNVAADRAVSSAVRASDVYRQAVKVLRAAERSIAAEKRASAKAKEEAGADMSAADAAEVAEVRRKEAEQDAADRAAQSEAQEKEDSANAKRGAEEDEAAVEAEGGSEAEKVIKLEQKRTDRELNGLKDKIKQLQVQLRVQHVKNLRSLNEETRVLQTDLQAKWLKCYRQSALSTQAATEAARVRDEANSLSSLSLPQVDASTSLRELLKLKNSQMQNQSRNHSHTAASKLNGGGGGSKSGGTNKSDKNKDAPKAPSGAMLALLADLVEASLSELKAVCTGVDSPKDTTSRFGSSSTSKNNKTNKTKNKSRSTKTEERENIDAETEAEEVDVASHVRTHLGWLLALAPPAVPTISAVPVPLPVPVVTKPENGSTSSSSNGNGGVSESKDETGQTGQTAHFEESEKEKEKVDESAGADGVCKDPAVEVEYKIIQSLPLAVLPDSRSKALWLTALLTGSGTGTSSTNKNTDTGTDTGTNTTSDSNYSTASTVCTTSTTSCHSPADAESLKLMLAPGGELGEKLAYLNDRFKVKVTSANTFAAAYYSGETSSSSSSSSSSSVNTSSTAYSDAPVDENNKVKSSFSEEFCAQLWRGVTAALAAVED